MAGPSAIISTHQLLQNDSMATNLTSSIVDVGEAHSICVHYVITSGTHEGTLFVEASNDETNFTPHFGYDRDGDLVDSAGIAIAAATAYNNFLSIPQFTARYMRTRYVASAGAGTLYIRLFAKIRAP